MKRIDKDLGNCGIRKEDTGSTEKFRAKIAMTNHLTEEKHRNARRGFGKKIVHNKPEKNGGKLVKEKRAGKMKLIEYSSL